MNEEKPKKKTYRTDDVAPSKMFKDAIYQKSGFGSDEMTCDWCGRLHLCPDADHHLADDDEGLGWTKYCEEEQKNNPDGVVLHHGYDAISGRDFNGQLFVVECPCNGLGRFERFIWAERDTIREFMKVRIDQELEWAEQEKLKNKLANMDGDSTFWKKYGT